MATVYSKKQLWATYGQKIFIDARGNHLVCPMELKESLTRVNCPIYNPSKIHKREKKKLL